MEDRLAGICVDFGCDPNLEIVRHAISNGIFTVIQTGEDEETTRRDFANVGVNEFLWKPFKIEDIANVVATMCKHSHKPTSDPERRIA